MEHADQTPIRIQTPDRIDGRSDLFGMMGIVIDIDHFRGIKMDVRTTAPCMQFYTGNNLHSVQGRQKYNKYSAFCMETQCHPNAVNLKNVPSIYIGGNKQFFSRTEYLFYVPEQI